MLPLNSFYREAGARSYNDLKNPKILSTETLSLPRNTTVYYFNTSEIDQYVFPLTSLTDTFFVHNITELTSFIGKPKEKPFRLSSLRKLVKDIGGRLLTTDLATTTTPHPVLVNFSALHDKYRYSPSPTSELDAFINYSITVLNSAAKQAEDSGKRNILLSIPVGNSVHDKQWFKLAESKPRLWLKNNINEPMDVFWIELNKYWLGQESWMDVLRGKDVMFMFHNSSYAVVMHNALFSVHGDVSERDESNGLVFNVPKLSESAIRQLLPNMLLTLQVATPEVVAVTQGVSDKVVLTAGDMGIPPTPESVLTELTADDKALSKAVDTAANTPDPYTNTPLTQISPPTEKDIVIPATTVESSPASPHLANISSTEFHSQYIKSGLYRTDLMNAIKGIGNAGIIVTGIEVTPMPSILGDSELIKVHVRGVDGGTSTLSMTIPALNDDGSFTVDSIDYRMRNQHVEPPIIKVTPSKVVFNSYFGTMFITRSPKMTDSITRFLDKVISAKIAQDPEFTGIARPVFDYTVSTPSHYAKLAQVYESVTGPDFYLYVNYAKRHTIPGYDKAKETHGIACGTYKGKLMTMISNSELYVDGSSIGTVFTLLGIPEDKVPQEYAQMKVMGVEIPVGVFLGSRIGLHAILDKGCKYEVTDKRRHEGTKLTFVFNDMYVHITEFLYPAYELILNSMIKMTSLMKQYKFEDFNSPDVYQLWVEEQGLAIRYFNEFEIIDKLFIDDVSTRQLLEQMHEPTEFKALLVRACELLSVEQHSRPGDGSLMRIRGNERIPGFIYKALTVSVRGYKNHTNVNKKKMELAPWEVFNLITGDNSVKPTENNNPIQFVKETETVTLAGVGGRSSEALSVENRMYDINDVGFIAEASTDSGAVGMVSFLSASPKLANLRGQNNSTIQDTKEDPAACYTTSYMLAPDLQRDHMPRVSFVNIQNTHNINIHGAETPYVRTEYEYIFPYKVGKGYAWMAKQDGSVVKVTKDMIVVKYKDGTVENGPLGYVPGRSADKTYPHHIVTHLTINQSFKAEDHITYNDAFFALDDLYPRKLCYKQAKMVNVAFVDDLNTHEDSFTVSRTLVPELTTSKLVVRSIVLNSTDEIANALGIGDTVYPDSTIMTITDAIGVYAGNADADSLKDLLAAVPKANTKGKIIDIEALYYSEFDDLSASIQMLVSVADNRLKIKREALGKSKVTGQVGHGHRISGTPMLPGMLEVKYFILSENGVTRGDKFVVGHQLKATVGQVVPSTMRTTNGITFDATFGYRSVLARIVQSYQNVGAYSRFMEYFGKYLAEKLGV